MALVSFTQAAALMLVAAYVLVGSSPTPMDNTGDTSPGTTDNSWWIDILDHAIEREPPHWAQATSSQEQVHNYPLQGTNFDPAQSQQAWDAAEHVAGSQWSEAQTSQSFSRNQETFIPTTLEHPVAEISHWQNNPGHLTPENTHFPSDSTPFDEGSLHPSSHHESFLVPAEHLEGQSVAPTSPRTIINSESTLHSGAGSLLAPVLHVHPDDHSVMSSYSMALDFLDQPPTADAAHSLYYPEAQPGELSEHDYEATVSVPTVVSAKRKAKRKGVTGKVAASKFLERHQQLSQRTKVPSTVPELSPLAQQLRPSINENFFDNKLSWKSKGDDAMKSLYRDDQFRQYVQRINNRDSWFSAELQQPWLGKQLVLVPHKSSARGNLMFDPEPMIKSLLFSFWTPSVDEHYSRLQFVGSASLAVQDAAGVLRQSSALKKALNPDTGTSSPEVSHAVEGSTGISDRTSTKRYAASKNWLQRLPLVEQVLPVNSEARFTLSEHLISEMHPDAAQIKDVANKILFGSNVIWQTTPEEIMLDAKATSVGIFRYHKRTKFIFLTKPEILPLLPYRLLLIPYELQNPRAKLFSVSLARESVGFTLWATHDKPGGELADTYYFVGGGLINTKMTEEIFHGAKVTLNGLKDAGLHGI